VPLRRPRAQGQVELAQVAACPAVAERLGEVHATRSSIPRRELRSFPVGRKLIRMDLQIGVLLPTSKHLWGAGAGPRDLVGFAIRAERLGYDSLFVNDSLLLPRIEPLTMLGALAVATEEVTLGTGALLPFLRRPVSTAQALASIDLLSGGRLAIAVGAGFPGRLGRPLYAMSELPWERRFKRLDETVALWRRLWTADGPTSFHGEIVRFDDIPVQTAPFRSGGPPIWLGGATPAALARTGRLYDGWLPYPPDPADYRTGLAAIGTSAEEAGRPAGAITPALFVTVRIAEDRQVMEAYAPANYGLTLDELEKIQAVVIGPPEHVAARLAQYTAAGARHLIIRIGALDLADQYDQLERLVSVVRPGA
jgi:alkanesulfonate monooxygenase SsuD/methylene tetrahydromethanopterin reductase-like flavin-dependent oxidoreductase (luciferase family)